SLAGLCRCPQKFFIDGTEPGYFNVVGIWHITLYLESRARPSYRTMFLGPRELRRNRRLSLPVPSWGSHRHKRQQGNLSIPVVSSSCQDQGMLRRCEKYREPR